MDAMKEQKQTGKRDENANKKTPTGEKIRRLVAERPEANLHQIGKELERLGILSNARSIYKIVRKDESLGRDVERIRELNAIRLSRDIAPRALNELERALKDRKLPREKKFPWTKLALDKEFGTPEDKRPYIPRDINLTEIRMIVNQTLNTDVPQKAIDAVSGKPIGSNENHEDA